MLSTGTQLKHHWEGGWLGGNGETIHQEQEYWLDRSTTGVGGTYNTYKSVDRIINNSDDTTPNTVTYSEVPAQGAEWCVKIRGQAGGIASSQPNYWGPLSKAYCVARDGANVFSRSDRNSDLWLRVSNFSGATITNVKFLVAGTFYVIGTVTNGSAGSVAVSGVPGSGTADLYYNNSWLPKDSVDYDLCYLC